MGRSGERPGCPSTAQRPGPGGWPSGRAPLPSFRSRLAGGGAGSLWESSLTAAALKETPRSAGAQRRQVWGVSWPSGTPKGLGPAGTGDGECGKRGVLGSPGAGRGEGRAPNYPRLDGDLGGRCPYLTDLGSLTIKTRVAICGLWRSGG